MFSLPCFAQSFFFFPHLPLLDLSPSLEGRCSRGWHHLLHLHFLLLLLLLLLLFFIVVVAAITAMSFAVVAIVFWGGFLFCFFFPNFCSCFFWWGRRLLTKDWYKKKQEWSNSVSNRRVESGHKVKCAVHLHRPDFLPQRNANKDFATNFYKNLELH